MPLPHQLDGDITHTGPKAGFFDATPVVQPSALTAASAVTLLADRLLAGTPALAIGSTDTQVATGLIYYAIATVLYSKAAVAAGSALGAGTIPADTWGTYSVEIGANGTIDIVAAAANFTTGYASEALARAALPATQAAHVFLGEVTILTASAQPFVGGTDSLEGGAAGNVATTTNYYQAGQADIVALVQNLVTRVGELEAALDDSTGLGLISS